MNLVAKLMPLSGRLKILVGALIVVAVFGSGWQANGWRLGNQARKDIERTAIEAGLLWEKRVKEQQETIDRLTKLQSDLEKANVKAYQDNKMLREWVRSRPMVEAVETDNAEGVHTDYRRGRTFRLCHNAAVSGDPAAAAECQAGSLPTALSGESLPTTAALRYRF